MNKSFLVVLALLVMLAAAVHEIPMKHRVRSPLESKRLSDYVQRGGYLERVHKLLAKIFPSEMIPNIYAYPEVKIINFLDAQYYGYAC
jgi:hypothetical protein